MNINFEFTAPNTPQQNGIVERAFATLYNRARAMLANMDADEKLRQMLWAEAVHTATQLDVVLKTKTKNKTPHEAFYNCNPKYIHYLRTFGEFCTVTNRTKIKSKLEDRGFICIFVGYTENHAGDVYRLYNPTTKQVILSRDVIWHNKIYDQHLHCESSKDIKHNDDKNFELEMEQPEGLPLIVEQTQDKERPKLSELPLAVRRLIDDLHPQRPLYATYAFTSAVTSGYTDPSTYEEAMNCSDAEKWREGRTKDFNDMHTRNVWTVIKKQDVPADRRLLASRWVFKKKKNGVYRCRLVAKGYNQIPGIDSFSPVINDVSFCILLIIILLGNLKTTVIDVETAFLHGELAEPIYMEAPPGYAVQHDECLKLNKCIYGLVQAARQWH